VTVPLPLEGVRVLDLTGVWAGSFSTAILGDLGAEVLKAENQYVWQPLTRGSRAHPTPEEVKNYPTTISFPNNDPGARSWNYCSLFVGMFRNKRSFTVDIRRPEGLEILGRVVARCDAVIENSTVGTMEKLGITYDWLREQREDIIFVRASGYGLTGEYSQARTLGLHLESVMGHSMLRGYEGADPTIGVFAADYVSGTQMALSVLFALWHRNNTGQGQFVELAQSENAAAMFAQSYVDYALTGNVQRAIGNQSLYASDGVAPCGVYACLPDPDGGDGSDRWIAITVSTDEEWEALRALMGNPAWAASPELATGAGRAANQDLLDRNLAEWTGQFDDEALFHRLQEAGIPAAPVLASWRVLADPHVQAHGLYQPCEIEDDIGLYSYPAPLYRLPASEGGIRRPPVALGQDNDYVYREVLGITGDEYDRLVAEGHIATEYDQSVR
jgi:crotonobetainyl-CoA:carnitine CoA-transferase CaiB-like acyl-CoA transferase